ncbi:MAG: outer membrane beta-barrel protein [Lentimicrobiaceae bacterium]|nr:outer membrane beta-barrel protein [Lentimicrobiaceae bacterium]
MKNKVTQTMKKTSLFLVLFLLVLLANGQVNKISIGIIGSPDFYNYQFKSVPGFEHEYKTKINYSLGLSINYNFAENASVKTGLLFSTKGYILEYSWAIAEPNDPLIPQESNIECQLLRHASVGII